MTSKIDWNKPLQLRRFGSASYDKNSWVDCRLVMKDRKKKGAEIGVMYDYSGSEELYWTDKDGMYCGSQCIRNKPENKKHIILTYRTGSGKLSSKVYDADFKNASTNQPYRVGDNYQGHKVLHTVEFELAS